jgi:pyruvate kinase
MPGGWVGDKKGINLPNVNVSTPSLTRKDMADLQRGIDHRVDDVALLVCSVNPTDVIRLRLYLEEKEHMLPIIAKIEKPEAWEQLPNEVLAESDGVTVARGDLGVEMAFEEVPFIQVVDHRARPPGMEVAQITATQMLESMIESPVPTRAEVSDVANAIFDGTDAVMLSAETSAGKFPVESAAPRWPASPSKPKPQFVRGATRTSRPARIRPSPRSSPTPPTTPQGRPTLPPSSS